MGNKNALPPKGPDTGTTLKEEGVSLNSATGSVSRDELPGLSLELLASLQSLRENSDYTLLPHSLPPHIAEAFSLKEDYQWAIQFLQLEKLYHERLLSNLAALQENWESQWKEKKSDESCLTDETDGIGQKQIETLSQICRTHHRPSTCVEENTLNATLKDIQSKNETLQPCHDKGVPQASDKDLAKLSDTEGSSSPDGLVSILKRRRASLDGLPPESEIATKQNSKRKVRFSEPEDGIEQDEVGGDSCLILLLLCLVTVVISIGGTALYCTLVDTYSNICTDFTHNVDFYIMNMRRFFEGLGRWLPLRT
ncbi:hypothetical protein KUCAC02_019367 [Chaenocephalus aceratus]|uniref:Uncharacterized protein n=1 Tax=Chaenocephalus aceratus TaxID=36190 RepID=A0ACB9VPL5_CHAAC|nr:hypothetical protein KUCAC02_019367 [Chaenocephalus aceratus]